MSPTSIFAPVSTPADAIFELSMFVLAVTAGIFVVVFGLLVYAVVRFRRRRDDDGSEPPQVYGSYEVELAWTIVPVLIVVALFLATARVIANVQHPPKPKDALDVVVIGHQYWWEYRYPKFGVVSANELHVPVSDPAHPTPTFLTLLSADTDHSFWVPRLAGKTDLIPNHPNSMWIDPRETGLYLGQCAQYCGTQHAKMVLRVYVDSREDFDRWIEAQRRPARADAAVARRATGRVGHHRRPQAPRGPVHRLCLGVPGDRGHRSDDHADPVDCRAHRLRVAAGVQPDVHHAWHHDDLLRGHAARVRVRPLHGAADDPRA